MTHDNDVNNINDTTNDMNTNANADINNTNANNTVDDVDPIVRFLASVKISDDILYELDSCNHSHEKYEKYFRATDLFIIKDILGNVRTYESDDTNINYIAFNNLMKWFMYLIAVNPWWHRKLCYYNRMMGVNTNNSSYWHLQYNPGYIPGHHWNEDMNKSPKDFNDEQVDQHEIYKWIDEEVNKYQ